MNIHKYARLTPHGREILVRRIEDEGLRVAEAAHASGVSVHRQQVARPLPRGGPSRALGPLLAPASVPASDERAAARLTWRSRWGAARSCRATRCCSPPRRW